MIGIKRAAVADVYTCARGRRPISSTELVPKQVWLSVAIRLFRVYNCYRND